MCFKSIMLPKRQMCLTSKRSRHPSGDCALRPGEPIASRLRLGRACRRPSGIRQLPDRYRVLAALLRLHGQPPDPNRSVVFIT